MGRAKINHHIGNGLYSVNLEVDVDRLRMRKEQLQDMIPQYELRIPEAQAKAQQAYATRIARETELNTTILTNLDDILKSKASRELEEAISAHVKAEGYLGGLVMELAAMRLELEQIGDPQSEYAAEVWCADYTEDLSGTVGTIEADMANGPKSADVQIRPGYNGGAAYNGQRDGLLQDVDAASPASFFYNLCMMPGVQKWMPRYSYGVVDLKNDETQRLYVRVTTGPYASGMNRECTVQYMDCGIQAFEAGDNVLLRWDRANPGQFPPTFNPVVVGFRDNPMPCMTICLETANMLTRITPSAWTEFYQQWSDRWYAWTEYCEQYRSYVAAWRDFFLNIPPEMQWQFADPFEAATDRWARMSALNAQMSPKWDDINMFHSYYWWVYTRGVFSITPLAGGISQDGTIDHLMMCANGGISPVVNPDYTALRSREYLGSYSLFGANKAQATFKTWWHAGTNTCNIALRNVASNILPGSLAAIGTLEHRFYIDDVLVGEAGAAFSLQDHFSFFHRSTHHAKIEAVFTTHAAPEGAVPLLAEQNWNIPVRLVSDVPQEAHLDLPGTQTTLTFPACTFDLYVLRQPDPPTT